MRINTNIPSLNAQRNLGSISRALSRSLERLSSGSRINSARDDASGLAVSLGLKAQAKGLTRTIQNMNEAFGYLNAADGALQTQMDLVQRMRELAIQAANGTLALSDRSNIQVELDQLMAEFNRLSSDSAFNGVNLLDGSLESVKLQVGTQKGNTIDWGIESSTETDVFTEDVTTSTKQFSVKTPNISGAFGSGITDLIDLNMDGAEDVVVNDFTTVSVFLNDGEGSFQLSTSFSLSNAGMEKGDFNGDGNQDLIFNAGSSRVVKLSDGSGGFSGTVTTAVNASQVNLQKIADFNNDGILDMLNSGATTATLHLGNGAGGFSAAQTASVGGVGSILSLDVNNDNYLDLVISSGTSRFIWTSSASGALTAGSTLSNVNSSASADNIVDLNGDGFLDFLYLNSTNFSTIAFGNSTATGLTGTSFNSAISGYNQVTTGDIDGDGDKDPIFSNGAGAAVRYLNNGGAPSTWSRSSFSLGGSSSIVRVDDFNNDGIDDIITNDSVSGRVYQLQGSSTGTFTTVATLDWQNTSTFIDDVNNDGLLDMYGTENDTGNILMAWNSGGVLSGSSSNSAVMFAYYAPLIGDLNRDGFKDFLLWETISFLDFQARIQNTVTNTVAATFDLQTQESASDALQILDNAVNNISARRAEIGALQNRLTSAISANSLTQENLISAYSQIVDADIAQETAELTRSQIQQQAAASVLGQANVSMQMALQLLNR